MGLKLCGGEIQTKLISPFPELSDLMAHPQELAGCFWQPKILGSSTSSTIPNACCDGDASKAGLLGQTLNNSRNVKCCDCYLSIFLLTVKSSVNLHLLFTIQCSLYELCDYILEA